MFKRQLLLCAAILFAAGSANAQISDPMATYQPGPTQGVEVTLEYIQPNSDPQPASNVDGEGNVVAPEPVSAEPATVAEPTEEAKSVNRAEAYQQQTAGTPLIFTVKTDAGGVFQLPNIPSGLYTIKLKLGTRSAEEQMTLESQLQSPITMDVRQRSKMRAAQTYTQDPMSGPGYRIMIEGVKEGVFNVKVTPMELNQGVQYKITLMENKITGRVFGE